MAQAPLIGGPKSIDAVEPKHAPGKAPTVEELEKARLQIWERRLAQFAVKEHATMFFDVPDSQFCPIAFFSKPFGIDGMKAMAVATSHNWKQIAGIQAFSRISLTQDWNQYQHDLFAWIESMDQQSFRDLIDGNLFLGQLDDSTAETVRNFAGTIPELNFALLENVESTKVAVDVAPRFTFKDSKTGEMRTVELSLRQYPGGLSRPNESKPPKLPARQITVLDKPVPGKLDFGTGSVMSLTEIIKRASETFGVRYDLDGRIAKNHYFVCGEYAEDKFAEALEYLTAVPAVKPHKVLGDLSSDVAFLKARMKAANAGKVDITWLREGIPHSSSQELATLNDKYGKSEMLDTSAFTQGGTVTASALCANSPGLANFLQQQGISPDTKLSLSFGMIVTIGCPGVSSYDMGWRNGQWWTGMTVNMYSQELYR